MAGSFVFRIISDNIKYKIQYYLKFINKKDNTRNIVGQRFSGDGENWQRQNGCLLVAHVSASARQGQSKQEQQRHHKRSQSAHHVADERVGAANIQVCQTGLKI